MASYWDRDEEDALIPNPSLEMTKLGGPAVGASKTSSTTKVYAGIALEPWWRPFLDTSPQGLKRTVTRLYYSRLTTIIYIATFLAAGVLLATTLGLSTPLTGAPRLVTLLEAIVSVSLIIEVVLRAIVLGLVYLQSWSNVLDAVIAVTSGSLLFVATPSARGEEKRQDVELSQSLVMLRVIVQFSRILFIAEHAQRMRKALTDDALSSPLDAIDLDFSALREQAKNRGESDGL